ncbi:MAG: hypothetical protein ACK40G_02900 [Cytophagaceae bacterium]
MKKFILIFLLVYLISYRSDSQQLLWANTAGGPGDDEAEALISDEAGNIYVTGFFKSPSITLGTTTLKNVNASHSDVFLAKIDNTGKVIWAKSLGGGEEDQPLGIALDNKGNIIIRGYSESDNLKAGNVEIRNDFKSEAGMFIAKYANNGDLLWMKSSYIFPQGIAIDAEGSIFVTGETYPNDEAKFEDINLVNPEKSFVVAKYSSEGKVQWAKLGAGGKSNDIAVDISGNVFVSGTFRKIMYFENGQRFKSAGPDNTDDMFLLKYNSKGNLSWVQTAGGQGDEEPRAIRSDKAGNIFVVLRYSSINLALGKSKKHSNGGGDDLLLIKYDPTGNVLWAESAGGSGHDNPVYLSLDQDGNVFLTGHYYSNEITFDNITLTNVGQNDIFIVKYSNAGKVQWAKTTGTSNYDYPNGQLLDAKGNLYVIGIFNSSNSKEKVVDEFFMEKYDVSGNLQWRNKEHRTDFSDYAFGEAMDKDGNLFVVGFFSGSIKFANTTYKSSGSKDMFVVKFQTIK